MSRNFPPQVYIIGAQKSGTTFLANLLDQHPGVAVSDPKEPHFFSLELAKGMDWYRGIFTDPDGKVLIDASTSYTFAQHPKFRENGVTLPDETARRIKEMRPDAQLIYLVRDPVDRAISAFQHVARDKLVEGGIQEMVNTDPYIVDVSMYAHQLSIWRREFAEEAFLVLNFDSLKKDPVGVTKQVLQFIGVDAGEIRITVDVPKNEKFSYRPALIRAANMVGLDGQVPKIGKKLKTVIPGWMTNLLRKAATGETRAAVDDADRRFLAERMFDDMVEFHRMTGIDFATKYRDAYGMGDDDS